MVYESAERVNVEVKVSSSVVVPVKLDLSADECVDSSGVLATKGVQSPEIEDKQEWMLA